MSQSLAARQEAFLRAIHDEAAPLPADWGERQAAGMNVYRGNYRSALLGALAESFARTRRLVGAKAFARASINHVIAHPPSGWTIDDAGRGFPETCARLFAGRPEVAELASLEATMLALANAPDTEPLTAQEFEALAAGFSDEDWTRLRLEFQPHAQAWIVEHDLDGLWRALDDENTPSAARTLTATRLATPQSLIAWREGERATFIMAQADHAAAFCAMQRGATFGEVVEMLLGAAANPAPDTIAQAAQRAGAMIGRWISQGMVTAINPRA